MCVHTCNSHSWFFWRVRATTLILRRIICMTDHFIQITRLIHVETWRTASHKAGVALRNYKQLQQEVSPQSNRVSMCWKQKRQSASDAALASRTPIAPYPETHTLFPLYLWNHLKNSTCFFSHSDAREGRTGTSTVCSQSVL